MSAGTASLCWTHLLVGVFVFVSAEKKTVITAEPGQDVALRCRAPKNNNKIIVVEWSRVDLQTEYVLLYRYDQFAPAKQHQSFKNRVDLQNRQMKDGDVSVILKAVTTDDKGTYECRIFMEGAHSWEHTIITLRVVPPEQKTITAKTGQNVTLTCRAPNSNIRAVEWSKAHLEDKNVLLYQDGQFVPVNQHPSFKNRVDLQDRQMEDGDVSVILKDVTTDDTGTYKCAVFMAETRSWELSLIFLSVLPPEQKTISADPGQDVTLTGRAPNSNILVVKWSRADLKSEDVLLYQDGHFHPGNQHPSFKNRVDLQDRQMKDGDVSVILKNVTIYNTGTYKCRVFMAETRSWELSIIYLRVVAPPGQRGGRKEDGRKKDGRKEDGGSVGLIVGLSVSALLLLVAVVGFVIYRKHKQNQDPYLPPVELQPV